MGYIDPPIKVGGLIRVSSGKPWRPILGMVVFLSMGLVLVAGSRGFLRPYAKVPLWILDILGSVMLCLGLILLHDLVRQLAIKAKTRVASAEWCKDYPWNTDFSEDDSHREAKSIFAVLLFLGAVFMAIALPPIMKGVSALSLGMGLLWTLAIPLILGLLIVVMVIYLSKIVYAKVRYKKARFVFGRTPPFQPGEEIEGYIQIDPELAYLGEGELTLWGVRESFGWRKLAPGSYTTGMYVNKKGFYKSTQIARISPDGIIPVRFTLPQDAPGTCISCDAPRYWELHLSMKKDSSLYEAYFLVPVYNA